MNRQKHRRIIISGGGTGGHVFPAISIANALKRIDQDTEILFVGAENRMEMKMVPAAGYRITGLPVAGFRRGLYISNITVVIKLFKSLIQAGKIIKEFKPDVAVGVGGYASGPILWQAARMRIPTLIQEQNSYAGVTNKLLAKKASTICVAYEGMEKYFPAEKIIKTGNPVRHNYENLDNLRHEALAFFRLSDNSPVILVLGGSLGAGSINKSLTGNLEKMINSGCQWLWQTGPDYYDKINAILPLSSEKNISIHDFINRMDYAYAAADIIVSRAGAGTISELCLVGKPVILVPSRNVAEDHQTKNALALLYKDAAMLVRDDDAEKHLVDTVIRLVSNSDDRKFLSSNIRQMAEKDADFRIAREVIKLTEK
jgi:UDP-N-acetylglucosamine--N-acetylmuramyl-(pentapeptide) pyrophosphoryl-undecaprenol N-acetylglucosamine transferase